MPTKWFQVDTTAAGDTFNGAVCVGVSEGMSLEQAVLFALKLLLFLLQEWGLNHLFLIGKSWI